MTIQLFIFIDKTFSDSPRLDVHLPSYGIENNAAHHEINLW